MFVTTSTVRTARLIALSVLIIGMVACSPPFSQQTSSHTPSLAPTKSSTIVTSLSSLYDRWSASNAVMFGYDAGHSHYNPFEKTLNVNNVAKLRSRSILVEGGIALTVVDKTLYFGSDAETVQVYSL